MSAIPSNYEINVSKDGRHFCKIELPEALPEIAIKKAEIIKYNTPFLVYRSTELFPVIRMEHLSQRGRLQEQKQQL